MGQPVKLRPWQRDILRGIYDEPTRMALITFGRKNAKTTLSAFLLLLHLCGKEYRANSNLYSAAQSREQAAILFSLAAKMVRMSSVLDEYVVVRDSAKELLCPELGTHYKALSAEASTAYGLSPVFIVHDELGQVQGPRSELFEALETATAAQENPLSIAISTQAPTDADLFSILIDDAKSGADPKTRVFIWTADEKADPFAEKTIRQANPAFGDFQNAEEVLAMAESARRMPSREAQYRNLVLNQRVEASQPFVTKSVWDENAGRPMEDWKDLTIYAGLDLSSTSDLTALVMVANVEGDYHVRPFFWLPEEILDERARIDRIPYDVWHKQGFLLTTPGKSVEYEYIANWLVKYIEQTAITKIGFDRWNFRHFKPWLEKAGMDELDIAELFEEFGQGFKDMSPALRELEGMLLNRKIRHGGHPVLTMCAANSVVKMDEAGGRKLDKKKSHGRIDGMVALAMAISVSVAEESEGYVTEGAMVL